MGGCKPKTLNDRGLCLHKYHNILYMKQRVSPNSERPGNLYTRRVFLYRLLLKQVSAASALRSQTCSIDFVQSWLLAQHETSSDAVSGAPKGSILGPLLYVLYISDLPTSRETTLGTFADDTPIFATHEEPTIASLNFQSTYTSSKNGQRNGKLRLTNQSHRT